MNFALTDEQEFLREAARGALGRVPTLQAARAALDGQQLPDLWPLACEAGWPGLLIGDMAQPRAQIAPDAGAHEFQVVIQGDAIIRLQQRRSFPGTISLDVIDLGLQPAFAQDGHQRFALVRG